jgi:outer membrane lipoprotein-sorting protein
MWRFTADSDPKATAIINQMVDTYHSMSAFSCTATFSDGQRSVVTNIQYLRSGYARVRIGNLVEGFVSPTETTVVHNAGWKSITILPTSPQVPEGLRGLTSLPAINTFVDDLPPLLESGGAEIGQIKATYLERRSSSTGDIDIVKLQYPKGTTKFLQVGTTDHLLYKAANHHTTLEGSTRQVDGTVSYSQILVNPPLTVEQLQFRAPKGVDVVDMRSKPSAEAEAILKSMVETYRTIGAMTLVDHFYQEIRIPNGILKGSWKMDAAYKLPGDVRALITPTANGRDYELEVLHGGTLSVAEGGAKHNYLRLSDDTPQVEEFGGLGSMAGRFQTMALLAHLAGETNVPFLHQDFKVAGRALLNGVPVLKLIATKMPPWKYSMGTQTISLYIGERDHLLHRAETETIYKKRRSSEITTEDISFQTTGRGNVPDGLFIFTPPQGMKAVQEPDRVFKDSEHQRKGGS